MITIERFNEIYEAEQSFCEDWEAWFREDPIEDADRFQRFQELGSAQDAFSEMVNTGIHHWTHPGWVNCLEEALRGWGQYGHLIKARMLSQSLLKSLPYGLYPHVREKLSLIASGDFCAAYDGFSSFYPAHPELYLSSLKWDMVQNAIDAEINLRCDAKASRF